MFKNKYSNKNSLVTRVPLVIFMIIGLLTSSGLFTPFITEAQAPKKVTICHATGSEKNPFVPHTPNENSTGPTGQGESGINTDDIIPASGDYEGTNLDTVYSQYGGMTGQEILDNNCEVNKPSNDEPEDPVNEPDEVTIVATKIVCPDPALLPRNTGKLNINENTATNFLNDNQDCYAKEGWEFQWSFEDWSVSPDNEGELSDWNTSESTDENGETTIVISSNNLIKREISMREVWKENYLEFAGASAKNVDSAEFYCQTDGQNLDNFDYIKNVELGETYYCVGWNVPKVATVHAHKIVCEDEEDMPKNGLGDKLSSIDEETATEWVDEHKSCELVKDWEFQWAPEGTSNPDDPSVNPLYGYAEGDWNTFGPKDNDEKATVYLTADDIEGMNHVWVREVLKEGYIPFTYGPNNESNSDSHSAEMYCHTDALNYDNYDKVDNIAIDNTYYCVAWNMPKEKLSEVEICKIDEKNKYLEDWQIALLGKKVTDKNVYPDGEEYGIDNVPAGDYVLRASGKYIYRPSNLGADASFSERKIGDLGYESYPYSPWRATNPDTHHLGLRVNGDALVWGNVFNPLHTYYFGWNPTEESDVTFQITDDYYKDNSGYLSLEVFKGYTGITEESGCVTFTDVPFGTYTVEELLQPDWENEIGLGTLEVDDYEIKHYVVNRDTTVEPEDPVATIHAHKIVCEDEEDMPKNGLGDEFSSIDEETAIKWVNNHDSCELVKDWSFQWAPEGTSNPDDPSVNPLYGYAEGDWNTFGPKDNDEKATVYLTADDIDDMNSIWIREVLKEDYIPFTYGPNNKTNEDNYSAEMYCHTDALNYDNYDKVDNIAIDNTYYCVAWNMKKDTNNGNGNGDGNGDGSVSVTDDNTGSNGTVSGQSSRRSGYYVSPINTPLALMEDTSVEDDSTDPQLPEGQVAGEQVSVVPTGAPDTGMGGTSSNTSVNYILSIFLLTVALTLSKLYSKENVLE